MLGTPDITGQFYQASPRRAQWGVRAVVDHVSGTADLPSRRIGGPDLSPQRIEVRANPIPAERNRFGSMTISPRPLRGVSSRQRATTAALGLRAGGGGLFHSFTIRREFGDQAFRDVSEPFHANQHGGHGVPTQGNPFPVPRNGKSG